jgi:hypothetical protein
MFNLTLILWLVIIGERLSPALDAQDTAGVAGIGLSYLAFAPIEEQKTQHTTQILSFEIMPTDAVHPETSSSYLGSEFDESAARLSRKQECAGKLTAENCPVRRQKAVLKSLFYIAFFESFLLCHDLV